VTLTDAIQPDTGATLQDRDVSLSVKPAPIQDPAVNVDLSDLDLSKRVAGSSDPWREGASCHVGEELDQAYSGSCAIVVSALAIWVSVRRCVDVY
jgi:hypothetical protein